MKDPEKFFESIRKDEAPVTFEKTALKNSFNDYIPIENTGMPPRKKHGIAPYYIPPASDIYNSCGQCVMATLLTYWGVINYNIIEVEAIMAHPKGKPDIIGGIFGTSWERVRDYLKYRGLTGFGANTKDLHQNSYIGKLEWLMRWTNNGYPVAVIVGNGELTPGDFGAHWVIVGNVSPQKVELFNMGNKMITVDTLTFIKAWQAAGLPWTHFASVVMWKQ